MPSPDVEGEEGSLSPHDQTSATQLKPAAKRKRENRYKNAPPSVLSVSLSQQSRKRHYHIPTTTAYPTKPAVERSQADASPREQRRRAQNRASQRAYRERKDQRIKDLEQMLNDAKARNDVLSQAYADLQAEYLKLKASSVSEQHQHQHQQIPTSYPAAGPPPPGLGGYVDPTMSAMHVGSDLGAYLYPEVGNYSM